jgi:bud site selection protein 20
VLTLASDLDQIKADLASSKHLTQYKATKAAEDLPGLGEFYCTECAKWFEGQHNMTAHRRGKNHKRRIRELKQEAHSQKLAEAVVGLGTDKGKKPVEEVEPMAED